MKRKLLGAAAAACLVTAPSLAYSQAPASGTFEAVDTAWRANGTSETVATITAGGTVDFSYPSGASAHTVHWDDEGATCSGVPNDPRRFNDAKPGWHGTCRFAATGIYKFHCDFHPYMEARVEVVAPQPTASPTAEPDATPTPAATATPTPAASPIAQTQNQPKTLAVKLARRQKGARVRGSVRIEQPRSKLEVIVRRNKLRVGRWSTTATAAGMRTFSIKLTGPARRALTRRSLNLTVAVTLIAPDGQKLSRKSMVRLRR
jgi:plastocyanin